MKEDSNWIVVAEKKIRQELDASKKELKLIQDVIDERGTNSTTSKAPGIRFKDQMFCMRACQEYSGSRVHMLEERIRQIHVWYSNERMGREIPDRVPDEWFKVDIEWRQWLSEQTTLKANARNSQSVECMEVRFWGPLIPLLDIYTG
ncbi:uncharacterized protein F4807DRAFT_465628 [Annulohypoxylon truncatum]|uniref:uncharacterized protein n=1 Tax=Annulohypoxylon truncatum TaxID=327061 RepID=UPI002007595E|nr:uncharacterized protein F4807DRAFT_465628 [Annulohypoxylon truncatum]KAI1204508.1 hypothetical protein F4807DRAFT_465628 [Annulohypoxylon truncatum]